MLSKNNKILIGCLALLLVMSVGYALFSDTITINGSATAKGEFELTTTCDDDLSAVGWYDNGSVSEDTITCNSNVVSASATLGYPGSEKWFRVMVTNTGTIPAKLKKVVDLNNPETGTVTQENTEAIIENVVSNEDNTNSAQATLFVSTTWNDDYEASEDASIIEQYWWPEQFDAVLDPGETAYFYVNMLWNAESTKSGDPLTPSLKAELSWEQVTQ